MRKKNILFASAISIVSAFLIMAAASSLYQLTVVPKIKLQEGELAERQAINQAAQESMADFSQKSEEITTELEELREENAYLKTTLEETHLQNEANTLTIQAICGVIESENLFENGKYKSSRQKVSSINPALLPKVVRVRYDAMNGKLLKKGN